jgi:hypothetical protein
MTSENLVEFPELSHQIAESQKARKLLEQVVAMLEHAPSEEPSGEHAQRLRGAAVLGQQAIAELWVSVGWLEAVQSAEFHGLLGDPGEES